MDAREAARFRLASQVMRLMRSKDFRDAFRPTDGDVAAIFVGLPDDPIRMVCERTAELGGKAHLVITKSADSLDGFTLTHIAVCTPTRSTAAAMRANEDDCYVVEEGAELSMLIELLRLHRGRIVLHVSDRETIVRLIDEDLEPIGV